MSLFRHALVALAAVALGAVPVSAAHAQKTVTVCKDGSRMSTGGSTVCNGHGGVDGNRTVAARRGLSTGGVTQQSSSQTSSAPRQTTTGLPLPRAPRVERPAGEHARPPARRRDHDDRDGDHDRRDGRGKHDARRDERRAPHSASARCVDGSYAHGKGNPKNVCKHHGGVARWLNRGR